jgi:predicted phage baseplate assembly protein
MRRYASGGGAAGNVPAGSVFKLRRALRSVQSVAAPSGARGGQDAQSSASARAAAPAWLRHRDRAVVPDDFEALACSATPGIARALCLPGRDVALDPLGRRPAPGCVSVALLPRTDDDARPMPSRALMARVRAFLGERCASDVRLLLCGPLYVRIDVEADVLAQPQADGAALAAACGERLAGFLHPARGGPRGDGWAFGQRPHDSELRAALRGLPGLAEVRQLRQRTHDVQAGAGGARHRLVSAGRISVRAVG